MVTKKETKELLERKKKVRKISWIIRGVIILAIIAYYVFIKK